MCLGADSGRIVIWNFDALLNEGSEYDGNVTKILCQIDCHKGGIS